MSEFSKTLVDKIKLAAGNYRQDNVCYYECEVVSQDDGTSYNEEDFTIRCKIISSKAIQSIDLDDVKSTIDTPILMQPIEYPNDDPNRNLGPLYLDHVRLMCGVDDGILVIPKVGSRVTVLNSTYQLPLVIQYSEIDIIEMSYNNSYNINVGSSSDDNNSTINVSSATMSMTSTSNDESQYTKFIIGIDSLNIAIADGAQMLINENIDIISKDGAEILIDDKILIRNNSNDLRSLLTDLIGAVNDLVTATSLLTVTCASPGSPSSPPINVANITAVSSTLSTISSDLSQLLN